MDLARLPHAPYGPRFRVTATYVDKILKGAKPVELPAQQPGAFVLVITSGPRLYSRMLEFFVHGLWNAPNDVLLSA